MKAAIALSLVLLSGCTTLGRTTTHEDSLLCIGLCFEQKFDSQVEIVKE
jgi:hypothetical protein